MTTRIFKGALAGAMSCAALTACAHAETVTPDAPAVQCFHVDGLVDGPHVPDVATASAIARAIIDRLEAPADRGRYDLRVVDEGNYWQAYQFLRGSRREQGGEITGETGGGGLGMRIAKCDGAITQVHYSR